MPAERIYLSNNTRLPTGNWSCEWTPEMVSEMKKCKEDIIHFAENYFYIVSVDEGKQKIQLWDCQRRVLRSFVENRFNAVVASRQIGKALDIDTPIPTPNGFKLMGDLEDGDIIFDNNGKPCNVLKAHPIQNNRTCYEVIFDNGERIIADEDHNWFTQHRTERKRKCVGSVKTTKEILNSLTVGKKVIEPAHRIAISKPVEYSEQNLLMSPYLLGVWLGDGGTNQARIHCGPEDFDELKQNIINEGVHISEPTGKKNKKRYINLLGVNKWSDKNCPLLLLKKLGVFKNKHIPDEYLLSSIEQRKELLRGLMDTDGYVSKSGVCQFYSSNYKLHEQVKSLLSSLGVKWSATSKFPKIKDKIYDEHFILTFSPEFECFKFKRKLERQNLKIKSDRSKFLYIKEVNLVESRPVRCITVDSPDSLFLCGTNYIVTHNTTLVTIFALWLAMFNTDQNIFILANKEDTAKMILSRVQMAYEEMPLWVKSPIKEFTKTRLKFENDSVIQTAATSEQGIRGQSCSCLILDEFAFIRPEIAHAFYESVSPTISSSRKAKVIMTSTPNGTVGKFYEIYSKGQLGRGHKEWNKWQTHEIMWNEIPRYNIDGELDYDGFKEEQIALLGGDLNSWYQEYCCVFHESGAAAINLSLLEELKKKVRKPMFTFDEGDYLVWEEPQKNHIYTIGVDVAEGVGLDYSVAQVLDITNLTDIRLVAQYHSNMVQPYVYAEKLNKIARGWGRPFMAIERNGPGGQVVDALYEIHKYDNIITYTMNNDKKGMYQKMGIYSHTNSKYTGIMNMKYWIEALRAVTIPDISTLKEYETFRRKDNGTWAAQDGFYDDRLMALVWALIPLETAIAQRYFSILQYDDVGKPRMIKDPNPDFSNWLGSLWDFDHSSTVGMGDPMPCILASTPAQLFQTAQSKDMLDFGFQGWTII